MEARETEEKIAEPSYELNQADFSDADLVYHFKDALNSVLSGDRDSYDNIVSVFHDTRHLRPERVALLETSLKALSGAVSCIDFAHHDTLIVSIFSLSMWDFVPDVMDAIVELIISLAVSYGKYVDSCLRALVRNFRPPSRFLEKLDQPRIIERKHQVLSKVHGALKSITDMVPLASSRLSQIVLQLMPLVHPDRQDKSVVLYVENLLKLESGTVGELVGNTMLMAVVDCLMEHDLRIEWDGTPQDDFSRGIFEMELEDLDEAGESTEEFAEMSYKGLGGSKLAETLDRLMVLTFEHLEYSQSSGRLAEVFETLSKSFRLTVLNAYKSKFTQFVMFYACALDPENCGERFSVMLADIFIDISQPQLTRISAVAYLASYLSRGKFLSATSIFSMLKRLVDWCAQYCKIWDLEIYPEALLDIKPIAHRVYYAACQAIMYVLCFRMKTLMLNPPLKAQLLCMPLEQILKHRFDPLVVCLPSVVQEFLRQGKAAHLFTQSKSFVFDEMLESEHSKAFGGLERLDIFFPFDPCLLKRCDSFIRPSYVFWSMVRPNYDWESDDGSSDDEGFGELPDEDGDFMDDGVAESLGDQGLDLDEFDFALNKMSITPKNYSFKFGDGFQQHRKMPSKLRPSMSPESL